MSKSILRRSVWCALTVALAAAAGHSSQSVAAQTVIPNDGPYKLTGNLGLSYVGTSHIFDPASGHLYSSTRGGVFQFDTVSMKVTGRTPAVRGAGSMSFDAARQELYVLALHDDTMNVIDVTTQKIIRTFAAPAWFNVFYEASRGELYYLRGDTREVSVADRQDGRVIKTLQLAGRPSFLEADPAHHRLLVRLADKPLIQIIDTTEHAVTGSWPARQDGQSAMAIDPDGSRVFISAGRDVLMLDGASGKELSRFSAGDPVLSIVYDPGTRLVAALCDTSHLNVAKVDGTSVKLLQSLNISGGVHELFLDPKSHTIFGITRLFDDGFMLGFTTVPASDAGSTLLTLTLK